MRDRRGNESRLLGAPGGLLKRGLVGQLLESSRHLLSKPLAPKSLPPGRGRYGRRRVDHGLLSLGRSTTTPVPISSGSSFRFGSAGEEGGGVCLGASTLGPVQVAAPTRAGGADRQPYRHAAQERSGTMSSTGGALRSLPPSSRITVLAAMSRSYSGGVLDRSASRSWPKLAFASLAARLARSSG